MWGERCRVTDPRRGRSGAGAVSSSRILCPDGHHGIHGASKSSISLDARRHDAWLWSHPVVFSRSL